MPSYTFHSLSDADFEELCADLLATTVGSRFQAFTRGRDGGIDLLSGDSPAVGVVVQCKHYWKSGLVKLKNSLKDEAEKLLKLKPKRLLLATSVPLTPANKIELRDALAPWCASTDDIYGLDDLNAILRVHGDIETRHHKLWLTSVAVMARIFRSAAAAWNGLERAEIEHKLSLYVQTPAYDRALKILQAENYCIVSGIPGIGKTTLAQILVTRLIDDGFELVAVREDLNEALASLDLNKRQVVYYDDFLGRANFGERLSKNEDRALHRLLDAARKSKILKVLLTTREYILMDALRTYEPLNEVRIEPAKCVVKVADYTRALRARILYNHCYFCGLSREATQSLLADRTYRRVVDHRNYSPRLVEWMTSGRGAEGIKASGFGAAFLKMLDDPGQIWRHAFEQQLTSDARGALLCLASIGESVSCDDLRLMWSSQLRLPLRAEPSFEERARFNAVLKQLDGSFIQTSRRHGEIVVDFHNASIRDFVSRRVGQDAALREEMLASACSWEQVSALLRMNQEGKITLNASRLLTNTTSVRNAVEHNIMRSGLTRGGWHRRMDVGQRLSELAAWSESGQVGLDLPFACSLASKLLEAGEIGNLASVRVCKFVEAVLEAWPPEGGAWQGLIRTIVDATSADLPETADTEGWHAWGSFVKANAQLFSEDQVLELSNGASRHIDREVLLLIEGEKSRENGEATFAEIESLAEAWELDLAEDRHRFEEWRNELEVPADEEWEGGGGSGGSDGGGSDEEIDRLFESLGDR